MRLALIFMEIVFVVVDIWIFLKYRKVLLEHSRNGKLRVPFRIVMPYIISMAVVSMFVPVFAIIAIFV